MTRCLVCCWREVLVSVQALQLKRQDGALYEDFKGGYRMDEGEEKKQLIWVCQRGLPSADLAPLWIPLLNSLDLFTAKT